MSIAAMFGANLAHYREAAGLSQEQTGFMADLHRTEISQLERGLRVARIDTVVKLAGALGVTPCELLDGIEWRPAEIRPGGFRAAGQAGP